MSTVKLFLDQSRWWSLMARKYPKSQRFYVEQSLRSLKRALFFAGLGFEFEEDAFEIQ